VAVLVHALLQAARSWYAVVLAVLLAAAAAVL
jgi:hypothetical protein